VLAANRNPVADPMPAETMFPLPVERRPIQVLDPHCRFIDIGTAAGAPSSARLIVLPHPIALRDAQPRRLDVDVRQKVIIRSSLSGAKRTAIVMSGRRAVSSRKFQRIAPPPR